MVCMRSDCCAQTGMSVLLLGSMGRYCMLRAFYVQPLTGQDGVVAVPIEGVLRPPSMGYEL